MVRLGSGSDLRDVRGTIAMADDAVVFSERDQHKEHRISLSAIRKAKRVRGSPILMLFHDEGGARRRTAFYFTSPPPLEPPEASSAGTPTVIGVMPGGGPSGRRARKRTMRANVRYLSGANVDLKDEIETWARAIRDAIAGSV